MAYQQLESERRGSLGSTRRKAAFSLLEGNVLGGSRSRNQAGGQTVVSSRS